MLGADRAPPGHTETISLISLHGRPLFLAARLKDHPPIPLRAAVMRGLGTLRAGSLCMNPG
jgi:hypothetical protein